MNFHIVILLSVVACALALPVPDEEVSVLQKAAEMAKEAATEANELLKKSEDGLSALEEGAKAALSNITAAADAIPKDDIEFKLTKVVDEVKEAIEDELPEAPKSMPVIAREETEPVVPVAGVRAEPKEGVEIGESKSTDSSPPGAEDTSKNEETKTETTTPASSTDKKTETPTTEVKPTESADNKPSTKPEVAGENKTDNSIPKSTETPKPSPDAAKPTEAPKETHDHSSEANKSDESAESKESEESNESNKSK